MAGNPDTTSTPSAQQQHNPPSLPSSPHPKRVKADNPASVSDQTSTTLPAMSAPQQQAAENASTPTPNPTGTAPLPDLSTLPPVSSLLPSMSSDPSLQMPMPMPMMGNGNMTMPMPMGMGMPMAGQNPIVPLPAASPPLMVKKLTPEATTPTRGSAFAAGYDLYASAPLTLKAKSKGLISTGLAIAVPAGTYGRVAPRSGLASKHFLDTGAGVIDADYRGEVKVLMFNFSDVDYEVKQGERVAQLVLERILTPEVVEVQELEESVRGAEGFGSTGYI